MREIKFRGKRTDNGEWVVGCLIIISHRAWIKDIDDKTTNPRRLTKDFADFRCVEVEKEPVGQYTGLKDKNGKEIYDGDVVWCRAGEHRSGIWEYEKRFVVGYGWSQSMMEMSMCDEIEVIGNIYDNPELMSVFLAMSKMSYI